MSGLGHGKVPVSTELLKPRRDYLDLRRVRAYHKEAGLVGALWVTATAICAGLVLVRWEKKERDTLKKEACMRN